MRTQKANATATAHSVAAERREGAARLVLGGGGATALLVLQGNLIAN